MYVEMCSYLFRKGRLGGGSDKKVCKWKGKISGMRHECSNDRESKVGYTFGWRHGGSQLLKLNRI